MSFYVGESIEEEYPMMNRRLGMKRSWNCDDLSSIDDLERHHARAVEAQSLTSPSNNNFSPHKRMRRYRATSLDSSEEKPTMPAQFTVAASISDDSITPKALVAPPIPASPSHVASNAVVTPESNSSSSDEVGSLPYFPSLRRNRSVSCDYPATAALERFMVKHRSSPTALLGNSSEDHFSVSFEDRDDDFNHQIWPSSNFDHDDDEEDEDKAISNQTRRVSMSSRKSSALSSASTSSCKLHPSPKSISKQRVAPTVRQITKALESLARI